MLRHAVLALVPTIPTAALLTLFGMFVPFGEIIPRLLDLFAGWGPKLGAAAVTIARPDWAAAIEAELSGTRLSLLAFAIVWPIFYRKLSRGWAAPLADRLWPLFPDFLDPRLERPGAAAISPFCPGEPFFGRKAEIAALEAFADAPGGCGWQVIRGPMGMGKTRLALEFAMRLRGKGWDLGLLEADARQRDLRRHRFRRPTLIVIDEWSKSGMTLDFIAELATREHLRKPVRVLIVDQAEPRPSEQPEDHVQDALAADRHPTITLDVLGEDDAAALAPGLGAAERRPLLLKLGPEPWRELARRAEQRLQLAGELLGANGRKLLALASLAGPLPAALAERLAPDTGDIDLLTRLFEGEDRARLRTTIPALGPELFAQELLLQWLTSQTAAADETLREAMAANPESARAHLLGMALERPEARADAPQSETRDALQRLFALQPKDWQDTAIARIATTADDDPQALLETSQAMLALWPDAESVHAAAAEGLQQAIHGFGSISAAAGTFTPEHRTAIETALGSLQALSVRFPHLAGKEAQALGKIAVHYGTVSALNAMRGGAANWTDMQAAMLRLDVLSSKDSALNSVKLECATAHAGATQLYRIALEDRHDARALAITAALRSSLVRLDQLVSQNEASAEIRLQCARGYVSAGFIFGTIACASCLSNDPANWADLDAALARLDQLSDDATSSASIALECARGYANATVSFCDASRADPTEALATIWPRLDQALARLDELVDTTGGSLLIQIECARGYYNSTFAYCIFAESSHNTGESLDLERVKIALKKMDKLLNSAEPSAALSLVCAETYRNAVGACGKIAETHAALGMAIDWTEFDSALARLDRLADTRPDVVDFQVCRAEGYRNAAITYANILRENLAASQPPVAERLRAILAGLHETARNWPDALSLIGHCFDATIHAETAFRLCGASSDAATQRQRLKRFGWEYPLVPQIQLELSEHFPHLTHASQRPEREKLAAQKAQFAAAR